MGKDDAKMCPWCERWCLKDDACNYIFACGLPADSTLGSNNGFYVGAGCGRSWCWECGKKFCTPYIHPETGKKTPGAKEWHTATCCSEEPGFDKTTYCPGGHNSHCDTRW